MSTAPLVLLHGFTGDPSSWDAMLAARPNAGRVIRPGLVGHRGGPTPDAASSWDGEVERLARIDEIEARPSGRGVVLAGYSLGARLALGVALARPACITRLVLVSASAGIEHQDARARRREDDDALAASIVDGGLERFVDRWESLPLFSTQASVEPERRAAHRARRLAQDPESLAVSLSALSKGRMPWLLPHAASLDVEVTLLVGARDDDAAAGAAALAARLPRATLVRVPDAGHDLLLERPDAVAAVLFAEPTGATSEAAPPAREPAATRASGAPRAPAASTCLRTSIP